MLRKIRSLFSNSDFIGIYDNALTKKECEILINQFEKSPQLLGKVMTGYGHVDTDKKSCKELDALKFSDNDVIGSIVSERLAESIEKYKIDFPETEFISSWQFFNEYNFQKYDGEEDGFKVWHCEHGPESLCLRRIMAWMFYLNDIDSGGETEFLHQRVRLKPTKGTLVLFPAAFTHCHRGNPPLNQTKYILTGWYHIVIDPDNC